jgi:vacuolar-type H+-ATPase subunit I/STV1
MLYNTLSSDIKFLIRELEKCTKTLFINPATIINMAQPKATLRTVINELVQRANADTRRLRTLEGMVDNLVSRVNSLEEIFLKERKKTEAELAAINSLIKKQGERTASIEKTINEIAKKLKGFATTSKIRELEELIDIYNPMKSNFITKEEVERLMEERG